MTEKRIHLNWSGCRDWHAARARLAFLKTALYGNFADPRGNPAAIERQLIGAGFEIRRRHPDPARYDVGLDLYGING